MFHPVRVVKIPADRLADPLFKHRVRLPADLFFDLVRRDRVASVVPLTVFQSLPVDGILVVTSPQDLVRMIVKKAWNMAKMMDIPVLGVVENFSWLVCPDCGKKIEVFGKSTIEEVAAEMGLPVAGRLPVDPAVAAAADSGTFETIRQDALAKAVQLVTSLKKN